MKPMYVKSQNNRRYILTSSGQISLFSNFDPFYTSVTSLVLYMLASLGSWPTSMRRYSAEDHHEPMNPTSHIQFHINDSII